MSDSMSGDYTASCGFQFDAACCPPLLRAPREIRDLIYAFVLQSGVQLPTNSADVGTIEENQGHGSIYYKRSIPNFASQGLLGTCRQLRMETVEAIEHCNLSKATELAYKLDLTIWECNLAPKWLWLPAPLRYVPNVVVDMRILYSDYTDRELGGRHVRGPGFLPQYLLQMLRRFLQNGPGFLGSTHEVIEKTVKRRRRKHRLFAEKLSITVLSMPVSEAKPGSVDKEWAAHAADDAAAFANVLSKYVDQVVNAGLLHEKIRTLELVHQGQSRRWDVTAKGNDSTTEAEWSCYGWGPLLGITQRLVNSGQLEYDEILDCRPPRPRAARKRKRSS